MPGKPKIKQCWCGIYFDPEGTRRAYCSDEHKYKRADERRGKSPAPSVDGIVPLPHRGGTRAGIIDRSGHRPLLKGETGQLYCRRAGCEKLLGLVLDRQYFGNHPLIGRRVRCDHCLYHGVTTLNRLTEALPILRNVELPKPAPTPSYSRSLKWTFTYNDDGQIVAATCEEIELADAA
jgi:hypothetical protein